MLNKLEKGLTHAENAVNGFLILAGVLVLFVNIIARAVFHNASSWAEEAIRYAIIWVTFFGGSQCAKAGNHVGIDLVIQVLPQNIQHILCARAVCRSDLLWILHLGRLGSNAACHPDLPEKHRNADAHVDRLYQRAAWLLADGDPVPGGRY